MHAIALADVRQALAFFRDRPAVWLMFSWQQRLRCVQEFVALFERAERSFGGAFGVAFSRAVA
jgi:hypothetical protein